MKKDDSDFSTIYPVTRQLKRAVRGNEGQALVLHELFHAHARVKARVVQ